MTDFEKRTRELLEDGADRVDGRTRSRLTQARHAALGQLERPARQRWRVFVPAGAAAAAAVLAVMVWVRPDGVVAPRIVAGASSVEDLEILADADAPLFTEDGDDVEFYEWAAGEVET